MSKFVTDDNINYIINKITTQINSLLSNFVSYKSHVGMVIHSTTLDTMEKVIAIYGGTKWVKIEGRFLLGQSSSYEINSTGGEPTHTLTNEEIPSHTHIFTGSEVKSGNNSVGHTHNGTTSEHTGHQHTHTSYTTVGNVTNGGSAYGSLISGTTTISGNIGGAHTHTMTTGANSTDHTHNVTAKGTNANTGGGSAHNNMPPYKTVYIWERIA